MKHTSSEIYIRMQSYAAFELLRMMPFASVMPRMCFLAETASIACHNRSSLGGARPLVASPLHQQQSIAHWIDEPVLRRREVDIGLVLALLLGVADGDAFERIDAVHAVLAWRSRQQQVTEGVAALYIAALKVCS